jgi:hypothetical protein
VGDVVVFDKKDVDEIPFQRPHFATLVVAGVNRLLNA